MWYRIVLSAGLWLFPAWMAGRESLLKTGHWSYLPLNPGTPPQVSHADWPLGGLDRYVMAGLEHRNLEPAPDADPITLCRRLHLVLTGIPPTPEEIGTFLRDPAAKRVERCVDRLLDSRLFGERWARHWLDVVRYAESVSRGMVIPQAWRYRDYVIDAFNSDLPFDQFVREQFAGDLLQWKNLDDRWRKLAATSVWMLADLNLDDPDKRQLELDLLDDQLDVVGKAFLAQTLTCARCHDHKFDPIPTREYYAMAGIFAGTRPFYHAEISVLPETPLPGTKEQEKQWGVIDARIAQWEQKAVKAYEAAKLPGAPKTGSPEDPIPKIEAGLAEARAVFRPRVLAIREAGPTNLPVLRRGNRRSPGEIAGRGVMTMAFQSRVPSLDPQQSGRRELAEWLVDPGHPLTARVYVNRVWHWVFGNGLVHSVDNFGTTGDPPSDPALLDHLARTFMEDHWSTKRLIRRMVTSHCFRTSGDRLDPQVASLCAKDPGNEAHGRFVPRRLEAEVLRDAMLFVSGELRGGAPGARTFPAALAFDYGFESQELWRSIYLPAFRNAVPESLAVFDMADLSRVTGERSATTIAPQAMYLLNNPFVRARAEATAGRLARAADPVGELWQRAVGRNPWPGERRAAEAHLSVAGDRQLALAELAHAVFGSLDFEFLR